MAEADGIDSVKERMKMIKSDREDCMVKLSMYYAQTIDDEALDRYYQTSEIRYHDSLTEDNKILNKNLEVSFIISTAASQRTRSSRAETCTETLSIPSQQSPWPHPQHRLATTITHLMCVKLI